MLRHRDQTEQWVHTEKNLMRSYLTVFVVATMAVLSSLVSAQQRGPSTPEERARVVQTAKALPGATESAVGKLLGLLGRAVGVGGAVLLNPTPTGGPGDTPENPGDVGNGSGQAPSPEPAAAAGGAGKIPGHPYRGPNAARDAFQHLEKFHATDPHVASERLHAIKEAAGLGPADNAIIGRTGDVYNPYTGEKIGSLTQGH